MADRRHLWKTLGEAVDKTVAAHRACLSEPPDEPVATGQTGEADSPAVATEPLIEYPLVRRHRERHAAIHDLLAQGRSQVSIAGELGVCARTVQRFAAVTIGQRIARAENRAGSLDRFKPYLHQRWNDGIHNPSTLHRELAALGWNGGVRTVNRYVAQLRAQAGPPSSAPATPKPRKATGWIMSDSDRLTADASVRLEGILTRCPELEAARHHVAASPT